MGYSHIKKMDELQIEQLEKSEDIQLNSKRIQAKNDRKQNKNLKHIQLNCGTHCPKIIWATADYNLGEGVGGGWKKSAFKWK